MPSPARRIGINPMRSPSAAPGVSSSGVVTVTGTSFASASASYPSSQLISRTSSRNFFGSVPTVRSNASLCCTAGCRETFSVGNDWAGSTASGTPGILQSARRGSGQAAYHLGVPRTPLGRGEATSSPAAGPASVLTVPTVDPVSRVSRQRRPPRYPRHAPAPVLVEIRRAGIVESRHRGHVVQVDERGDVVRAVGDPDVPVTLRSAIKPFALVALLASGAAEEFRLSPSELAIMAASHGGEDLHVRTLQGVFRRAGISQTLLACGNAGGPLDELTAARLARDGERPSTLRHNCSGFHTASLLLSRHSGWTPADYWRPEHPSQAAIRDAVCAAFGVPLSRLQLGDDDCGVQTYAFPLVEVARAYRLLADPDSGSGSARRAIAPHLRRVRDAMMAAPEMIGGTNRMLDTQLMRLRPDGLVAKGGAESLCAIGIVPGGSAASAIGPAGIAVKIEDGDGFARANHAVTLETLRQLGILDERDLADLGPQWHPVTRDPHRRIVAETIPSFELAPIAELA